MARFFIDKDNGDTRTKDRVGIELATPSDARDAVLDALPDLARNGVRDDGCRTFRAVARDESGRPVYRATMTRIGSWD
jgi:hypothetical protein